MDLKIFYKIIIFRFLKKLKTGFKKEKKIKDFKKENEMKAGTKYALELDKDTQDSKKLYHNPLFLFRLSFFFHWLYNKI